MIVVGLSGKARTGKSHLTRELFSAAEKLGWNVEVMPSQDRLSERLQQMATVRTSTLRSTERTARNKALP